MERYTIMCAILGHRQDAFEININSNEKVSTLKRRIKEEQQPTLGSLDFELYRVNLPIPIEAYKTVIESITQRTIGLDDQTKLWYPLLKLSDMNGQILDGYIHILVDPPAGEAPIQLVEIVLSLTQTG